MTKVGTDSDDRLGGPRMSCSTLREKVYGGDVIVLTNLSSVMTFARLHA